MTKSFSIKRLPRPFALFAGLVALLALAACGGGGSGGTAPQTSTAPLTLTPTTIVFEPGAGPAQLTISGGVKPYTITSSQPNLIAVPGIISGDQNGTFTIVPAFGLRALPTPAPRAQRGHERRSDVPPAGRAPDAEPALA